jgi:putative endonuclease
MSGQYYVYILTNKIRTTLYIGVTNDLVKRLHEHKCGQYDGFTKKYNVNQLVYYEETNNVNVAINREKRLKQWNREWKDRLIEKFNPEWRDLAEHLNESLV